MNVRMSEVKATTACPLPFVEQIDCLGGEQKVGYWEGMTETSHLQRSRS